MAKGFLFSLLFLIALSCNLIAGNGDSTALHKAQASNELAIMTYNVKFLPRGAVYLHHHPVIRARFIPAKVIGESPDVVVFEEAFDGAAIRALKRRLKRVYPYMAGGDNRRVITYKRAGGVLIFSKYPMKEIESIRFTECKGIDCKGNKGAILVEVAHPVQKFQLLGTHLQAGGKVSLKVSQYREMGELLKRHMQPQIPQFIAGDFNTHKEDTALYPKLVAELNAVDGMIDNEQKVLDDHNDNDLRGKVNNQKKKGAIDFIFVKENGVHLKSQERYAREFQQKWSAKHKDLSDHFAVILKAKF